MGGAKTPQVGYYAVAKGRKPGVYREWKDCAAQVLNFYGAKYKKFLNASDAELWIIENTRGSNAQSPTKATSPATVAAAPTGVTPPSIFDPAVRPHDTVGQPSGTNPSSSNTPPAPTVQTALTVIPPTSAPKPSSLSSPETSSSMGINGDSPASGKLIVYTDGSCRGNGKAGSTAGVGVWWGEDDPRNVSERCPGDQTNNRAELLAIIRVLERAPTDRPLQICCDSAYSINCMSQWLPDWKARGWKRVNHKAIQNLPLIQYADLLLEERRSVFKQNVEFEKVPAHTGITGNEQADRLANQGTTLPPVPELDWEKLMDQVRRRMHPPVPAAPAEVTTSVPRPVAGPAKQVNLPSPPAPPITRPRAVTTLPSPSPPTTRSSTSQAALPATQPQIAPRASQAVVSRVGSIHSVQSVTTSAELSNSSILHGRSDVCITRTELEAYANCLLDDMGLMDEAYGEGVMV